MFRSRIFVSFCLALAVGATARPAIHGGAVLQESDADAREFQKLFAKGSYDEAIVIGERLTKDLTNGKAEHFKMLVQLAAMYRAVGEFGKAGNAYRSAIVLGERVFGSTDIAVGSAIERLACLERRNDHLDEAKNLQVRAFQIIAPLPTGFHPGPAQGTVVNGKRVAMPKPAYPKMAERLGIEGTVSVGIIIDETGKPIAACAEDGAELLALNAEAAAFQARFTPTTLNQIPVRVSGKLIYNFKK